MKKLFFILIFISSLFADLFYVNDNLSKLEFRVTQFLFINIDGQFNKFEGNIIIEDKKISSINGSIQTSSLFTNIEKRDKDLKSSNYFNIKKHESIIFQSIFVEKTFILAKLTIRGITKDIKFNIDKIKIEDDFVKINIFSFINMNDFDLDGPLSLFMNKKVEVFAEIYANKI